MPMDYGSVFQIAGNPTQMRMRVTLVRNGLSFSPDFNEFSKGTSDQMVSSTMVDEVGLRWQQKIARGGSSDDENEENRGERRIFTVVEGEDMAVRAEPEQTGGIRSWFRQSPHVDFPMELPLKQFSCPKKSMLIYANLGDLSIGERSKRDDYLICQISLLNDRTMIFEPPLTNEGYKLETKLGEYVAKVQIWDEQFAGLTEAMSRLDMSNLPDMNAFELADEGFVNITYHINIHSVVGTDFDFDGVYVEWNLVDRGHTVKGPTSGRTSQCYRDEKGLLTFSHPFELTLSVPIEVFSSSVGGAVLVLRATARDYWGRQWNAGYGQLQLPMQHGRQSLQVPCWMPFSRDPTMKLNHFFIGDPVDVDYLRLVKEGHNTLFGLDTQSSGTIHLELATIVQSRMFMTKDTLHHIKYGAMLGRMGLKSDLYWRIMKVLMEFEEARKELLRVRNVSER